MKRGLGPVLLTGGAGFMGTNLAHRLLRQGIPVVVFDNLSRAGVGRNVSALRSLEDDGLEIIIGDVRDRQALASVVRGASAVFHFAAQVAVTTSLDNPLEDFAVNAGGTLNVLEALRSLPTAPPLVFTSTNKVYGALGDLELGEEATRYQPVRAELRHGVGEERPVEFHSPYGCSKGSADQYVSDYARTFGLRTTVFRLSCIYGPFQMGCEDQGWLAHFMAKAIAGEPITLFGDGKQVRDVLFVDDLLNAFLTALEEPDKVAGKTFNLGGGPENAVSLLELLDLIAELRGERPVVQWRDWRAADQRYYVSNFSYFRETTGWSPKVGVKAGVERLHRWMAAHASSPLLASSGALP